MNVVCVGPDVDGCSANNGGCSELCITGEVGTSHHCLCADRATTTSDTDACSRQQLPGNEWLKNNST